MKYHYFLILFIVISVQGFVHLPKNERIKLQERSESNQFIDVKLEQLIHELTCFSKLKQIQRQKASYFKTRELYKNIEFFVEHIAPYQAKFQINGANVLKYSEYQEGKMVAPKGFQRIEELMFSTDTVVNETLLIEINDLINVFKDLKLSFSKLNISDNLFLEMQQFQLYRIAALNLNGYDATFTKTNLKEVKWNLDGMQSQVRILFKSKNKVLNESYNRFKTKIKQAKQHLLAGANYDDFDRINFIRSSIIPLNISLIDIHNALKLEWTDTKKPINLESPNFFAENAFNMGNFSLYNNDTLNLSKQIALGKILFFDPILSANNQRACASCHNPVKGFSDQLIFAENLNKTDKLKRNTPGLIDVSLQKSFFYDGRALHLEQQIVNVIHNKEEMGSHLSDIVQKLRQSKEYIALFQGAFDKKKEAEISEYAIQKALTEYEKSLLSFNSRFDSFIAGNTASLSKKEQNGYNLFAGKALCGSCHFFPVFNGTVPPLFTDSEFEIIGTPLTSENLAMDTDLGRFTISYMKEQIGAFKTPTVRNSELTAPYMHNGVFSSLLEVLKFYKKGGGNGQGYTVPYQTLPFDSLNLSELEMEDIILFMKSLTDTSGLQVTPQILPSFEGKSDWNTRTWGGSN